jgi:hypothetical protein
MAFELEIGPMKENLSSIERPHKHRYNPAMMFSRGRSEEDAFMRWCS